MKKSIVLAALGAATALAAPAQATELVFQASDHTGGKHGLWVNDFRSGDARFFSYQNDAFLKIDTSAGTGSFSGTAINNLGEIAAINITFSNWLETTLGSGLIYKKEGGAVYNELTDMNDVDFFAHGAGTIDIDGQVFNLGADAFRGDTLFQYGLGANAKNANEFGASAWLNIEGQQSHWDMNFNLTAVPEPGTWMLMLLGFAMIGGMMRSKPSRTRLRVSYN